MLYLLWQAKLRDALEPGEYAAHASRDRSRERARDLTARPEGAELASEVLVSLIA